MNYRNYIFGQKFTEKLQTYTLVDQQLEVEVKFVYILNVFLVSLPGLKGLWNSIFHTLFLCICYSLV